MIKTLAKPAAKRIKHEFSKSQSSSQFLITLGQAAHSVTSRMTIWSEGYTVRKIAPLEPDKALQQGSELVGEFFVFFVAGSIVVWEYKRSKAKEETKEQQKLEKEKAESERLETKLHSYNDRILALEEAIHEQKNTITRLNDLLQPKIEIESKSERKWWQLNR